MFLIITLLTYFVVNDATLDIPVHDTYVVVQHIDILVSLCTIFFILGGIYHLFVFITGKRTINFLNILHLVLSSICLFFIYFPLFFIGLTRSPRRYYSNTDTSLIKNVTELNLIVQAGIYLFIIAQLIFIRNIILTLLKKRNENNLL